MHLTMLRRAGYAFSAVALAAAARYVVRQISENRNYFWGPVEAALASGYSEQQVEVRKDLQLNYVESSAETHGQPPLLLLPGQGVTWQDYGPVLSGLAKYFHVIALDVHGHGRSTWNPGDYQVTTIAQDLLDFATARFGRPFLVSGHSSGGLIAVQMAATDPDAITKLIIEDAPFFATGPDRVAGTYVGQDNGILADYLALDNPPDWVVYSLQKSYIGKMFGDLWPIITRPVVAQRQADPGIIPNLWWLPPTLNRIWESISHPYDKWFSHAFFISRTWHDGFDQATALSQVQVPSLFIKATTRYYDGVLLAALNDHDVRRVDELLPHNTLLRIDAGHDVHFEKPQWFIDNLVAFSRDETVPVD